MCIANKCWDWTSVLLLLVSMASPAWVLGQMSASEHYQMAEKYKRADNMQQAITHFDSALLREPRNYNLHFEKGKCHLLIHEEDQAIQSFENVIYLRPDHIESYSRLAWLYERKEDYQQVIRCLELAAKYHSEDAYKVEYKLRIIKTLQLMNRFNEAGKHIEEAKWMVPKDSPVYVDILYYEAKFQNMHGEYEKAIATMKEAIYITQSPEDEHTARFYYELGYAYYHQGEFRNARAAFSYATHDDFKPLIARLSPEYNYSIAVAFKTSYMYKQADEMLQKCLTYDKGFADAHEMLQDMAFKKGNLGAIKNKKTAIIIENDPSAKATKYMELGEFQIGADKFEDAINSADSCLALKGDYIPAHIMKAMCYYHLNDMQRAIGIFQKVADAPKASYEQRAQAFFLIAMAYKRKSNWDEALKALRHAHNGIFSNAAEFEEAQISLIKKGR